MSSQAAVFGEERLIAFFGEVVWSGLSFGDFLWEAYLGGIIEGKPLPSSSCVHL